MGESEWAWMYEQKERFIKSLEQTLKIDYARNQLKELRYIKPGDGFHKEVVEIEYDNGYTVRINTSVNSNGANAKEIIKEIYGEGALGRFEEYWNETESSAEAEQSITT